MEESQKFIPIHSNISPNLLLNLQNNYFTTNNSKHFKSYFSVVQKFKQKQQQRTEENKKKNGFVQKFYQKLKKDLQNSTDEKSLKQNLSLMNICLKHKHKRHASQSSLLINTHRSNTNTTTKPKQVTRRQLPLRQNPLSSTSPLSSSHLYYLKTNRIIDQCQKQNKQMNNINKKMGLFRYYNKKLTRNLYNSQVRIKRSEVQF